MKTHSAPPLYVGMCERNRWLVSVSPTDCRVWNCQNSKLVVGFKVNNPEFVMARLALTFASRSNLPTDSQLVSANADLDRYTLDDCKQPLPTISDVIRTATERADLARRENSRAMVAQQHGIAATHDAGTGPRPLVEAKGLSTRGPAAPRFSTVAANEVDGATEDDASTSQMITHRVICAHADSQERFVFYALGSGDVRMHRIKSGQLVKTLLTMSPSTELIYAAVLQCRHMYTYTRNPGEGRHNQDCNDAKPAEGCTGTHVGVHDVAFVLHRLLREGQKLSLERVKACSVHREVVGMMTPRNAHELCVVYADGLIRFFPLLGSSVHAHRIIIPEFLVSKALSYLRVENALIKKEATIKGGRTTACSEAEAAEAYRNVMVEADAVSFIAVSQTLNLICLVQVNGRVSLMGMGTAVGLAVQVFYVAGEVAAISFLGGYPCLVVGEAQGTISFYLLRGAPFLDLFDNFYRALLLHRRQQRTSVYEASVDLFAVDKLTESSVDGAQQHGLNSAPCIWSFRVPGTPTVLHFDAYCCSLYVGTRQGFVTSYLVRNLIVAANLHPVSPQGKTSNAASHITAPGRHPNNSAELDLCNVLLVFFNLTPDRVMTSINRHRCDLPLPNRRRKNSVSCSTVTGQQNTTGNSSDEVDVPPLPNTLVLTGSASFGTSRSRGGSSVPESEALNERVQASAPLQSWRPSLLWIYDSCRSLFHSQMTSPNTVRGLSGSPFSLMDLSTVTLSDFLLGAAILHYILQLMQTKRNEKALSCGDVAAMDGSYTSNCAAMISSQELRHIRQCILEEVYHRRNKFDEAGKSHRTSPTRGSSCPAEEFVEAVVTPVGLEEASISLTGDWVELLFRRHAVNTVSSSPLTLLSMEAIIERARRERRERTSLLMKYVNKGRPCSKEASEDRGGCTAAVLRDKSISVNWNAFLEGAPPDCITEALRRCHDGATRDEDAVASEDNGAIQCITTRRNGVLYVGSADGSVGVWTAYACARLQEFSPCSPLDSGIRRIGEFIKSQFTKQWKGAENLRQRKAYASGTNKQKLHEAMMRNITLKYKVALLKQGAKRGALFGASGLAGGGNSVTTDSGKQTTPRRAAPQAGLHAAGGIPLALYSEMQNFIKKPKELLMAALPIDESEMESKNILMEDLYFLPMQMSVLSELEDLDGKTYATAVDLSVARLLREVCGSDGVGADSVSSARGGGLIDRSKGSTDEGQMCGGALPPLSSSNAKRTGEAEYVVDSAHSFFLSSHGKHMSSFYLEARRKLSDGEYSSQQGYSLSHTAHSVTFVSLQTKMQRATSNFPRPQEARSPQTATPSEDPASAWPLPTFAQAGAVGRPGVIVVAISERREEQLDPQFEFDLPLLVMNSQWVGLEVALRQFVSDSDGTLTMDSFQCFTCSMDRNVGRTQRGSGVPCGNVTVPPVATVLPSILTREAAVKWHDTSKGIPTMPDPLLVIAPGVIEEGVGLQQSDLEPRQLDRTLLRRGSAAALAFNSAENTAAGRRCSFFFTETHDLPSVGKLPLALSTTVVGGKWPDTATRPSQQVEPRRSRCYPEEFVEAGRRSAHPMVNARWALESKQQYQRARLSRTGRTVVTPPSASRGNHPHESARPQAVNRSISPRGARGVGAPGPTQGRNPRPVNARGALVPPSSRGKPSRPLN